MSRHWTAVIMAVVLALGCRSPGPVGEAPQAAAAAQAPAKTVELGMSASEVETLLGTPSAVQPAEADPSTEVWVYVVGKVVLYDGKVVATDPSPFPRP